MYNALSLVAGRYIQDKSYRQKTIYKLNLTTQTQDNAVLLQATVMVRCGSLNKKYVMKKGDFTTLGATAHSIEEREENDFYATDPKALEIFLEQTGIELKNVWECACGEGHLAKVLDKKGLLGRASDLIDRGYGVTESNFYYSSEIWEGDILTNPPYGDAMKFCQHALDCVDDGRKVVMLMRIQFLEGQRRKPFLIANPPKYVYVSSSRLLLAKNADFVKYNTPSANCYAWYVWEKGFTGETTLRWFN